MKRLATAAWLLPWLMAACGHGGPEEQQPLGQRSEPIINGELDTTHQAAVAYLMGGLCTATIIAVEGDTGYALTAAHCIGADLGHLYQGDDFQSPQRVYPVEQVAVHPEYGKSQLYDFAMLRFSNAAGAPVIPALPPELDKIKSGTTLDLVGYGMIEDSPNDGITSKRHHKLLKAAFATDLRLIFNQQQGGMCSGDSGGPALYATGNAKYVGGVHSYITSSCSTQGTSLRVSAVYDTFIAPFMTGAPYGKQTCAQCTEAHVALGQCTDKLIACFDDAACSAYYQCLSSCSTSSCAEACAESHPDGEATYQLIYDCVCDSACVEECGDAPVCNAPACGLDVPDDGCQECFEKSCCAEAQACGESELCRECLSSPVPPPECESDAVVQAFTSCVSDGCSQQCAFASDSTGSAATSGAGAGGDTGGHGGTDDAGGGSDAGPLYVESGCTAASGPAGVHGRWWLAALAIGAMALRARNAKSSRRSL